MNNTVRLVIGLIIAGALAALADPALATKLPAGVASVLAAVLAAVLHKMNSEAPADDKKDEEPKE